MRVAITLIVILSAVGCAGSSSRSQELRKAGGHAVLRGFFISPMGEPFRSQEPGVDLIGRWFSGADKDSSSGVSLAELEQDAARFFTTLDVNSDGEIDPDEMRRYENEIAPEIRMAGRSGGAGSGRPARIRRGGGTGGRSGEGTRIQRGAGRGGSRVPAGRSPALGILNLPQPVAAADADFNRGVSREEFRRAAGQRFLRLDRNRDASVTLDELAPPGA